MRALERIPRPTFRIGKSPSTPGGGRGLIVKKCKKRISTGQAAALQVFALHSALHDVLFRGSQAHDKPTGSMGSSLPWHSLPAVALSGGRWWCEEAGPLRIAGREAVLAITDVRRAPAPDLIGCRCSACSCWLAASASTLHVINHAPRHSAAGRVFVCGPGGCTAVRRGHLVHAV